MSAMRRSAGEPFPLSIRELVTGYRMPLFGPATVRLAAGEVVALLGPNGSGKSTLLRTIATLLPPLSGEVHYGECAALSLSVAERSRRVALVLTRSDFSPFLSVEETVALGRIPHTRWHGLPAVEDRAIVKETLTRSGLEPWARRRLGELSDGERQRALIARAVAQQTPVILLDEPTAHLDLSARHAVLLYLHRLAHETGVAVLFSTHDYDLAMQVADRMWVMEKGGLETGVPEDLALGGVLDRVFGGRDTRFDAERGVFVRRRERGAPVRLEIHGAKNDQGRAAFEWTRRALSRAGYEATEHGEAPLRVELHVSAQGLEWKLDSHGKTPRREPIRSIGDLISNLPKTPGH